MVFELKISLEDVGAPVWRKVQIEKDANFYDLHLLIQAAFDWSASHMYGFDVVVSNGKEMNNKHISHEAFQDDLTPSNQKDLDILKEKLSDWFKQPNDKIEYVYDYGDHWLHLIELIGEVQTDEQVKYPICISGENYAPPEDSRFDVIQGNIDLIAPNNDVIPAEVNELIEISPFNDDFEEEFLRSVTSFDDIEVEEEQVGSSLYPEASIDLDKHSKDWTITLKEAKQFLQAKPWKYLREDHLFVIEDPTNGSYLFCKVNGHLEEQFGLEIYVGLDGFFALLQIMAGEEINWDGLQHEYRLLVSFEDRTDLNKEEYDLIKTHPTTFRGKKSWPIFRSFKRGYVPWGMNQEELAIARLAMSEVLNVIEEQKEGLVIPNVLVDEEMVIRKISAKDDNTFKSEIIDVESLILEDVDEDLVLSELELKRFSKITTSLPNEIEFTILPLNVPVQNNEGGRPFLPCISLAFDEESKDIYHQELIDGPLDLYKAQKVFLNVLLEMNGIPVTIYIDPGTARLILPFLDEKEDINFVIEEDLQVIEPFINEFSQFMMDQF